MKKKDKVDLALFLPSLALYVLVAWILTRVVDHAVPVWAAFVALVVARMFFALLSMLADAISWRAYMRQHYIDKFVERFRSQHFPPRKYYNQSFETYLHDLKYDQATPPGLQIAVAEVSVSLEDADIMGYFKGRRLIAAGEAALDIYSPRAQAPDRPAPHEGTRP